MASLAASLLACPASAQTHGTYQTTYSGGSVTGKVLSSSGGPATCSNTPQITQFTPGSGQYTGGASVSANTDSIGGMNQCSANIPDPNSANSSTLTATLTWQPNYNNPNELLPSCAIVTQYCDAFWAMPGADGGSTGGGSTPSNGLNGVVFPNLSCPGQDCNSTLYSAWTAPSGAPAPASFPKTCKPAVSFAGTTGAGASHAGVSGSVGVTYAVSAFPMFVNISGAIKDPNANNALKVLTGQQITATLSALPSGFTVKSYNWSTAGTTGQNPFWTWDPTWPNSTNPTQFVPLSSAETTASSFSFYDEHGGDSVTVLCSTVIQPPTGPTLSVTAKSPPFAYIKPSTSWTVNTSYNNIAVGFFSGLPNGPFGTDELWGPIKITEPPLFTNNAPNSSGFGVIVQVASLNRSNTRSPLNGKPATYSKLSVLYSNNTTGSIASPTGLDAAFPYPYGSYQNTDGTFTQESGNYGWLAYNKGYSSDQPAQLYTNSDQDGGGNAWNGATASDSFQTWVMYRPASVSGEGTIYVPMQMLTWSWGGTASLNHLGFWDVNQIPMFTSTGGSATDVYPAWNLSLPVPLNLGP